VKFDLCSGGGSISPRLSSLGHSSYQGHPNAALSGRLGSRWVFRSSVIQRRSSCLSDICSGSQVRQGSSSDRHRLVHNMPLAPWLNSTPTCTPETSNPERSRQPSPSSTIYPAHLSTPTTVPRTRIYFYLFALAAWAQTGTRYPLSC
jgi:hypothetical protein